MTSTDWEEWHQAYAREDSGLAERLAALREQIGRRLDDRLLARLEVRQGDAAHSDVYAGSVPADLVLLWGIFGNITDAGFDEITFVAPEMPPEMGRGASIDCRSPPYRCTWASGGSPSSDEWARRLDADPSDPHAVWVDAARR